MKMKRKIVIGGILVLLCGLSFGIVTNLAKNSVDESTSEQSSNSAFPDQRTKTTMDPVLPNDPKIIHRKLHDMNQYILDYRT